MRSRAIFVALLLVISAVPLIAHAGIPFLGPIIPPAYATCPAGWGMLMTVINNIIMLVLTVLIIFVAPIMIAYAGFLFVINPVSPEKRANARGYLLNTVVGITIALSAWLIVGAIMAVLYNPTDSGFARNWWAIINSRGDPCLKQDGAGRRVVVDPVRPRSTATGFRTPPTVKIGTSCDPAVIKSAAASGGFTLTDAQASTFACIARYESSCSRGGDPIQNYNWAGRRSLPPSSAAGAFQVLLKTNSRHYENRACYLAAGLPADGSIRLNCASGFYRNGMPITGNTTLNMCLKAASNLNCSTSAAASLMLADNGSFRAWQASRHSSGQTRCITGR